MHIPWFTIEDWHVPLPVLDHIPPFAWIVVLGVALGTVVTIRRARRAALPASVIVDAIEHVVITGFVCSHLFDAIFYYPDRVAADPLFLFAFSGGMSSFGGFFGALLGAWIWKLRRGLSIVYTTDYIAYGFPLGFGIGRIGCFLMHDHPGTVTSFPLAVANYHVGQPPYLPRHDLGLYEALYCMALMLLFVVLGRRPRRPGLFLGLLPALYSPVRFVLDFLRETPQNGGDVHYFGLTPGHYSALVLGAMGLGVLVFIYRRPPLTLTPKRSPG